jgi:hypothetical protein
MVVQQRLLRIRIAQIAVIASSFLLMAGYVHFSATGQWIPGMNREVAQQPPIAPISHAGESQSGELQSAPPNQTLFPGSKDAVMFSGSKSRVLINPSQETRTEFFVGSKSAEIFDEQDVAPAATPQTETPATQPGNGE